MTRINSAIPVYCLTDEHLLAEHREIKRLSYCFERAVESGSIGKIPDKFALGSGHVLFFLDKFGFIRNRYVEIYEECKRRKFNVEDYSENFERLFVDANKQFLKDHEPTEEERLMLVKRITERIMKSSKKSFHYCGKAISKAEAVQLLIR